MALPVPMNVAESKSAAARVPFHRAIYDYFHWLSLPETPVAGPEEQPPTTADVVVVNDNKVSSEAEELKTPREEEEEQNAGTESQKSTPNSMTLFPPAEIPPAAETGSLHVNDTSAADDGKPEGSEKPATEEESLQIDINNDVDVNAGDKPAAEEGSRQQETVDGGKNDASSAVASTEKNVVDEVLKAKIQKVMNVLEQEFPEILQVPAENVAGKPFAELEMRFNGYPLLYQRVSLLERMSSASPTTMALQPPLPPPPTATATASIEDIAIADAEDNNFNNNKRKEPPKEEEAQAPANKKQDRKQKDQASEIKKMKQALRRAKEKIGKLNRAQKRIDEEEAKQKAIEVAAKLEKQKQKAIAASVPFEQRFQELVHFQRGYGHCRGEDCLCCV